VTATFLILAAAADAQETVKLTEALPVGTQYHVNCKVEVQGNLTLPLEKGDKAPKTLTVAGTSVIEYHERVLTVNKQQQVKTTLRMYRKLDFQRKVGDQAQASSLRPEVRRMVILRHNQVEVPFSPDGPMTWSELDLVRTDVFTPALTGLLPSAAVKLNDRWVAADFAVQELTDLDKIDDGKVSCQLEQLTKVSGRRVARIGFSGSVRGVGEDGPTRHTLDGHLLFDLDSSHVSYISVRGTQTLLDKDGKAIGKIDGTFVLTRRPDSCKELSDEAIRSLKTEPDEANTLLLYDNADLGVRFLHPRRWRVAGVHGRQVGLDEDGGSGMLLTVETAKQTPTAAEFLKESKGFLEEQKAKVLRVDAVKQLQGGAKTVETFSLEVEISGQKVLMTYFVLRQAGGGATIAARVTGKQQALILADLEKIAKGMELNVR
jgi:hypothetical protein